MLRAKSGMKSAWKTLQLAIYISIWSPGTKESVQPSSVLSKLFSVILSFLLVVAQPFVSALVSS